MAPATRSKLTHVAKALFKRAVLWKLLSSSPFEGIKPGPQTNPKRARYIGIEQFERIQEACGCHEWKCIFGVARLAGLRCPSELSALRWGDVDFEKGLLTVTSPKTEHHADGAMRLVPTSPRLHQILLDAYSAAEPGAEYVVPRLRYGDTNLRTQAHRILIRAGIEPPPKIFVNMRSSCATDWANAHGGHVAAKWCGHSPLIALKHYAQVRPEDIQKATGRSPEKVARQVAQNGAETVGNGKKGESREASPGRSETLGLPRVSDGFRPVLEPVGMSAKIDQWAILDSNQ